MIKRVVLLASLLLLLSVASPSAAPTNTGLSGNINVSFDGSDGKQSFSVPVQIVLFLTLLSFIPAILISVTSFTRIVIVFHFLRQALGTAETPSNQIMLTTC